MLALGVAVPRVAVDYAIPASPVYGALCGLGFGDVAGPRVSADAARGAGLLSLALWSAGGTALAVRRFGRLEL